MSQTDTVPRFHFSVDDVFDSLIEVSERGIPLFEHAFFAFLREVHDRHAAAVDLYVFLEQDVAGRRRSLAEVADRIRDDLQRAPWLRFGPHALDYDHPPYAQPPAEQRAVFDAIYRELDRFAGPDRRSAWVRLHYFSEAYDIAGFWRDRGVSTLLLTDKPAVAYHLPDAQRRRLGERGTVEHRGLVLRRSHERLEVLAGQGLSDAEVRERLDRHVERHGFLVAFSHEVDLRREPVRAMCHACLDHVRARGLSSF